MNNEVNQSERGAVVIWFAMLIVLLLALLSLAVDIGWLFVKRTQLQNAADAAALSCGSFNYRTPGSCQNGDTASSNPTVIGSVNPDNFSIGGTEIAPKAIGALLSLEPIKKLRIRCSNPKCNLEILNTMPKCPFCGHIQLEQNLSN